jgi:hypothetical protein
VAAGYGPSIALNKVTSTLDGNPHLIGSKKARIFAYQRAQRANMHIVGNKICDWFGDLVGDFG